MEEVMVAWEPLSSHADDIGIAWLALNSASNLEILSYPYDPGLFQGS